MSEYMWSLFKKCESRYGVKKTQCVLCEKNLSYAHFSDLKDHLIRHHYNDVNISELSLKRKPRLKSTLWKHFSKTNSDYIAECKYCGRNLSFRTTIANLKKHLVRTHPGFFELSENENGDDSKREESEDSNSEDADNDTGEESEQQTEQHGIPKEIIIRASEPSQRHRKLAVNSQSDSEDDQNYYTEVVYVEEEEPPVEFKPEPKKSRPEPRKRNHSSIQPKYETVKIINDTPKEYINTYTTKTHNDVDEDIENFGRYIIGLLKKIPKDLNTQLQLDIINLIMAAKLKKTQPLPPTESVNMFPSSVQDGEVVVTTPNNVISTSSENIEAQIHIIARES